GAEDRPCQRQRARHEAGHRIQRPAGAMNLLRKLGIAIAGCALGAILVALCAVTTDAQDTRKVIVLNLDDTIQPISEEYVSRGLAEGEVTHAAAVLIELNTPGGLLDT